MTTKQELKLVILGVLLIWALVLMTSCGPRKVQPGVIAFERPTWVAVLKPPTESCPKGKCESYAVLIESTRDIAAVKEQVCTKTYICAGPEPAGQVITIERRRK